MTRPDFRQNLVALDLGLHLRVRQEGTKQTAERRYATSRGIFGPFFLPRTYNILDLGLHSDMKFGIV